MLSSEMISSIEFFLLFVCNLLPEQVEHFILFPQSTNPLKNEMIRTLLYILSFTDNVILEAYVSLYVYTLYLYNDLYICRKSWYILVTIFVKFPLLPTLISAIRKKYFTMTKYLQSIQFYRPNLSTVLYFEIRALFSVFGVLLCTPPFIHF